MSDFEWEVIEGEKIIAQFVWGVDADIFIGALDGTDKIIRTKRQTTGLRDKSGKEIRVGDIVHLNKEPINEQQAEKD